MDAGATAGLRRRRQRFRTDGETLRALESQHAFPALVLEHRSLSKCAGAAEELVDLARVEGHVPGESRDVCVRLRGTIHQTNTETGRLAMEEPNLQILPHPRAIPGFAAAGSTRLSSPSGDPSSRLAIRGAFRAPLERVLLSADYKQLELRVAAHFSKDEALLAAFANERHDPFDALASRLRGGVAGDAAARPSEKDSLVEVAGVRRVAAGTRRRGGGGIDGAAVVLADTFKASIPGMERWRAAVVAEAAARTPPHVVTLGGRRRRCPKLAGRSAARGGADGRGAHVRGERRACQGSAADIVKRAMLDVFEKLTVPDDHHGAPSRRTDASDADADAETWRALRRNRCRLVLQVHDELVFELGRTDAVSTR